MRNLHTTNINNSNITIKRGDCLKELPKLPDGSVDAVVTDPPYETNQMGRDWDRSGVAFCTAVWEECLRVLKPGGYLLAFGATRTVHRLTVAIEDAGFEIRNLEMWMFGSGSPAGKMFTGKEAADIRVARRQFGIVTDYSGWATGLKPGYEPIVLAQKPRVGSYVNNVKLYGTGMMNIPASRYQSDESQPERWPSNVHIDDEAGKALEDQWAGASNYFNPYSWDADLDKGFHYVPKPTTREKERGLKGLKPQRESDRKAQGKCGTNHPKNRSDKPRLNFHPTVKPVDLMRRLLRRVTPPGGTVLDPFAGSGTTMVACVYEGFNGIAIEMTPRYMPLIKRRVNTAHADCAEELDRSA